MHACRRRLCTGTCRRWRGSSRLRRLCFRLSRCLSRWLLCPTTLLADS
jgi:hypothetical protein